MGKQIYFFGSGQADGDRTLKELLGGKGAGLAEMSRLGIPVPPGFTITTEVCNSLAGGPLPAALEAEVRAALDRLGSLVDGRFGDPERPMLLSVRSGARASMPGMMDTILNLGLDARIVDGLARRTKSRRFALDSYRRFIVMYSDVVLGVPRHEFDGPLRAARTLAAGRLGVDVTRLNAEELERRVPDSQLDEAELERLVAEQKAIVTRAGATFPDNPFDQLKGAIHAVFKSWFNPRAKVYQSMHDIPESWGTACNVQAMVFGNLGDESATGVAFTRDPSTGEKRFYGEWLPNAQGEDVVAGIRTPHPIAKGQGDDAASLEARMPAPYAELVEIYKKLEKHFRDMQDIEFTIQSGKLFMLQCRSGKRTGRAAVRIAVEMVREKLIDEREAVLRVDAGSIDQLLHPTIDPKADKRLLARGLPASPGAASGHVVFNADEAERRAGQGKPVILVRSETSPEDIHGMKAARGILTARGGMTCVAGETRVLTDRGLLSAERGFQLFEAGEPLRILSLDARTLRPVWREVIAAGRRPSEVVTAAVSQTGRAEENVVRLTADHKMVVIARRRLEKKPLDRVLADEDFVTIVDHVPPLAETAVSPALAYVAGAILSDGYVMVKPTKGSVTFVQKPTPEKADFIHAVELAFQQAFGVSFSYVRERQTTAVLRGRTIQGSVEDRICFRREPAACLARIQEDPVAWVLGLDRTAVLHFLAGYVDGDGSYAEESSAVRLQIVVSEKKPELLEALAIACLRLGIVPQVSTNREAWLLQIAERVPEIVAFTHRVRPEVPARVYESRCLSARALFDDVVEQVNFMGRVREGIKRNLMFGTDKMRRDILPLCPPDAYRELAALLDAPLRSCRMSQKGVAEAATVYNFEVGATDELDKNFVVFSSRLTPVLVSNSHAAVVARGMGKSCVAGCSAVSVNYESQSMAVTLYDPSGRPGEVVTVKAGDVITLDGGTGSVYLGAVSTVPASLSGEFAELMVWADRVRKMRVRANADTPLDARTARNFGAEGIGLCRTEHMFFDDERIAAVREMILAGDGTARRRALDKLLPFQREDFAGVFREMAGLPVTIRLLDPPLHEFLPHEPGQLAELARTMGVPVKELERKNEDLREFNPMLGHRGCRLAITFPEIYEMQARAILEAACQVAAAGIEVFPEIMIPLAMTRQELVILRELVDRVATQVFAEQRRRVDFHFGTMIELPRAALVAGELAQSAEFFSFGTNDLTQTALGLSRDDAGRFLGAYVESGIFPKDPFQSLDVPGVGALVRIARDRGRQARPGIKLGICGEHGGDPASIQFFGEVGLDYVSCSPFRVPVARLAAAQAALRIDGGGDRRSTD